MIDSILNLLFRCGHRRLTRPVAPVTKAGQPPSKSYVVCLDCGKQFEYDVAEMRIGKVIDNSHRWEAGGPARAEAGKPRVSFALLATLPAFVMLGALFKGKKRIAKNGH